MCFTFPISAQAGLTSDQLKTYHDLLHPLGDNPYENLKQKCQNTCLEDAVLKVRNKISSDLQKQNRATKQKM